MRRFVDYMFVLLVLFSACGSQSKSVVAVAGKRNITAAQFQETFGQMDPRFLPPGTDREAKLQFVNDMINKELMAQEAWKLGYDKMPEVSGQVEDMKKGILLQNLYKDLVSSKVKVKKGDLKDLYALRGEEFHVFDIVVKDKKLADSLLVELRKGAPFHAIARMNSIDTRTGMNGGEMGLITADSNMDPVFQKALYGMKAGELSQAPLKTDDVYHIIKVTERRKRTQESLEKEKPMLESEVRKLKERVLVKQVLEDLKKKYAPKVEEKNLPAFDALLARREKAAMDTSKTTPPFKLTPAESSLVLVKLSSGNLTAGQYLQGEKGLPSSHWTKSGNVAGLKAILQNGQFMVNETLMAAAAKRGIEKRKDVKEELNKRTEELMVTRLYYDQIVKKTDVSDQEIAEEYKKDPKKFADKNGNIAPLERAKFDIKQMLLVPKQEAALENYFKELRKAYPVTINEKNLEKVNLEHGKTTPK